MNKDLTTVVEWLKGNRLSVNVEKTKAMIIETKKKESWLANNSEELSLKVLEEGIHNVLAAKYLGIQVDRVILIGNIASKLYHHKSVEQLDC